MKYKMPKNAGGVQVAPMPHTHSPPPGSAGSAKEKDDEIRELRAELQELRRLAEQSRRDIIIDDARDPRGPRLEETEPLLVGMRERGLSTTHPEGKEGGGRSAANEDEMEAGGKQAAGGESERCAAGSNKKKDRTYWVDWSRSQGA